MLISGLVTVRNFQAKISVFFPLRAICFRLHSWDSATFSETFQILTNATWTMAAATSFASTVWGIISAAAGRASMWLGMVPVVLVRLGNTLISLWISGSRLWSSSASESRITCCLRLWFQMRMNVQWWMEDATSCVTTRWGLTDVLVILDTSWTQTPKPAKVSQESSCPLCCIKNSLFCI